MHSSHWRDWRLLAARFREHRHPNWTLAVGARPEKGEPNEAQMNALGRSFAVVRELSSLSHRDGVAETVGWDAVKRQPGSESGIGLLVLVTPSTPKP